MSMASVASCLVVPVMSSDPADTRPAEVFRTFVSELAAGWERHPCAMVRLASLVENLDGHSPLEHGDEDPATPSRETPHPMIHARRTG